VRQFLARAISATLALVLFAGCSMFARKIPETHRYQLVTPPPQVAIPPDVRIELRSVSGGAPYQDTGLAVQTTEYRIDSYRFHRWVAPPTDMVADRLRSIIYAPSSAGVTATDAPTAVMQADVQAFQQVQTGSQSSGLVTIQTCLFPNGIFERAFWCHTFSKSTPSAGDGPEAAAAAINASLNDVLQQLANALPAAVAAMPKPTQPRAAAQQEML
jgi:ABC-type uncharacterized transport system auxiliary subunit